MRAWFDPTRAHRSLRIGSYKRPSEMKPNWVPSEYPCGIRIQSSWILLVVSVLHIIIHIPRFPNSGGAKCHAQFHQVFVVLLLFWLSTLSTTPARQLHSQDAQWWHYFRCGHGQRVEAEHDFHHHSEDGVRDAAAVRVHESFVPCHGLPVGDATHAHVLGFHIVNSCDPKIRKVKTCKNHQRLAILCRVFMILMAIAWHHLWDLGAPHPGCFQVSAMFIMVHMLCLVVMHMVPLVPMVSMVPMVSVVPSTLRRLHWTSQDPSLSDLRSLRPHLGTFQLPTKTRCITPWPPWPASAWAAWPAWPAWPMKSWKLRGRRGAASWNIHLGGVFRGDLQWLGLRGLQETKVLPKYDKYVVYLCLFSLSNLSFLQFCEPILWGPEGAL